MTIDSATGITRWTPGSAQTGSNDVTIRVEDTGGLFDTQSFTITVSEIVVVNNPPSITSTAVTTAAENVPYAYDVNATDPDNDALTYSLDVFPEGMTIDSATGLIAWTPGSTQVGSNNVTVRATDTGGLFDTQSFTISVTDVNHPPVITSTPVTEAVIAETIIIKEFNFNVDGVLPSVEADTEYINNNVTHIRSGIPSAPDIDNITEEDAFSVSGGIISQRTLNKSGYAFYQSSSNPGFDPALGLVIEARFKILDILGDRNTGFWEDDVINRYQIMLEEEGGKTDPDGELIPFNGDIGCGFPTYLVDAAVKSGGCFFFFFGFDVAQQNENM